ncbi:general secretion pathway protein GspN [Photobacterium jeanii]|uniref:Type II secretion system protein N n=1 Tax=Photobacterium jeanii TaxID=858640 RepID=A0A178KPB0_9GAMM|nr:type II secretion system protein N [Photobacterium jeanii]OAN19219.1 general secretion pathway protein GspN [Photobacterium jeanii]PST87227.1 type II secretion system protein N [Photobacterium jeanii]
MKYKFLLGTSFGVALLGSAVAHIPASWLWLQAPMVPGLSISGIQGTPWEGRASQVRWQQYQLGQVQWQFNASALFTGKVAFSVRFGQGSEMKLTGRGIVGYGTAGAFAENLLVSLPAPEIIKYARLPAPVTVDGTVELTVRDFHHAMPFCQTLDASVAWSAANITSPLGAINPGPVIADLTCDQGKLMAKANQSSPDVSSDWQASLAPNYSYTLLGWFKPGAEFPSQLGQQLKWLGDPDGKGRYNLNFNGRL